MKPPDVAKHLVDLFDLQYPILCDVEKQVIPQYCALDATNVIPSIFIIDMWGVIRWKHIDDGTGIVLGTSIIETLQTDVPLAVTFASLTALTSNSSVTIKWSTESEIDNLGFNIYRATEKNPIKTKLNATLMSAQSPGSVQGAIYAYTDDTVEQDVTYFYWLESVYLQGLSSLNGPVSATVTVEQPATYKVLLPFVLSLP